MRAGAASLPLDPPLGLPMLGFVRQIHVATGTGWPLETGAVVLEQGDTRVVLCGVDIVGLQEPASDSVIDRIADACECDPAAVLLSWNHTHLAPPGDERMALIAGQGADSDLMRRTAAAIQDRMVEACRRARERLEPAEPVWAVGEVDEAVNRRERTPGGRTILGWNPARQLDRQVTALQLRRPDDSAVATLVGFGCHPVTTGYDMDIYSADYPGPLRALVRSVSGGECVFLQGAAGDVLPRVAFTQDEREAERLGRRVALEALHALADRHATRSCRCRCRTSWPSCAVRPRRRWPTRRRGVTAARRRSRATRPTGRAGRRSAWQRVPPPRPSTLPSTRSASGTA
jgi:neutral ceramidase